MKNLYLPKELRNELRKPFGVVYENPKKMIKEFENPTKIISVGDIVTYNLLNSGIIPDISFVDNKTKRIQVSDHITKGTEHPSLLNISVINPAGVITGELIKKIENAMNSKIPVKIFIEGEEDLAALPSIMMAPISSVVIYGLPDKGAVLVKVTHKIKKKIESLINRMESKEE